MNMKRLERHDYTAGWICPLEVEQIAALHMLDERHLRLPQPATDHNVYNLGSIHGHNVVIAGLPQAGNNSAATVVTQLRISFPNVRFVLLVGIGGGVPSRTDNGPIRLGDVVVSKPTGTHSGVIQYDHGKAWVGQFERTGSLAPPPAVLLNAAQDLAAARAMEPEDPLEHNMRRINSTKRSLRHFAHPGLAQDRQFLSAYTHLQRGASCDECNCDVSQTIARTDADDTLAPNITVHRGIIASGEMVLKDATLRDQLAAENLICFEMEAAGALFDFPCMVIRGISDYCDSHKNDAWHGYASAAAASYARQLFFHVPIDELPSHGSVNTPMIMETIENGFQDISSQISSLILNVHGIQPRMSHRHTQGVILANDENSIGKLVRGYIRQAIQDCKTIPDDEILDYVYAISMDIAADAQKHALFGAIHEPTEVTAQNPNNLPPAKDVHQVATSGTGAKNRKSRFIKLFRTQKRFHSKVAVVNVRLNQLRQARLLVPDTMSYFSIEVDIIPRVLTQWGLSLSFSNVPNEGGYFSICPSIRPTRIFAYQDLIWKTIMSDDVDAFRQEYWTGKISATDCSINGKNVFYYSLWQPTLECCRFIMDHSNVPIDTLFESAGFLCTEDFLGVDTFGQGHLGTRFALTDLAIEIIKVSECEPSGHSEDAHLWYRMWWEAERSGLPPTADELSTWVNRITSLGINFVPFSWPRVYDRSSGTAELLDYHRWLLVLCLGNGGNPNAELGFADECVPLEFALTLVANIHEDLLDEDEDEDEDDYEDEYNCYDLAYSLLVPLINAGANIYYIREHDVGLQSITDLAFSLDLSHCWEIALSECGLDLDAVIEEDERNLLLYQRGEPAVLTGIDIESIRPARNGLRRRR